MPVTQRLQLRNGKNRDQTHKRAASKGRRGTLAVLEYERGAILSLRLSKVGRVQAEIRKSRSKPWRCQGKLEGICGGPCVSQLLALTITQGLVRAGEVAQALLSHTFRNPTWICFHTKNPQFSQPAATTDFDISISVDTPSK